MNAAAHFHHIALGARDVETVASFYRVVFDLAERARHFDANGELRSIWLDVGGVLLMVERTTEAPRDVRGVGVGPFLIAFATTVEQRAELERRLESSGSGVESRSAHSSYFRDPEGNRCAMSHYPDSSA